MKKVQSKQADLSPNDAARARDLLQHRKQDVAIPAWRGPIVWLRDPESVTQRNQRQHGRGHGSASREVFQARPLQGQNEAVADAETVADRNQEVASGKSWPSKETAMLSLKTMTGGIRDINNVHEITDLLAPNDPGKLFSAIERKAAGWGSDGRGHSTQRQLGWSGKGCQKRPQRCVQRGDSLQALCQKHLRSKRQVQNLTERARQMQRQGRRRQESEQRKRSMQEVWKDHETTTSTLGKVVSTSCLGASCDDTFVII